MKESKKQKVEVGGKEKEKNASFREGREAASKTGSICAAFKPSVAQYLEPFSRN